MLHRIGSNLSLIAAAMAAGCSDGGGSGPAPVSAVPAAVQATVTEPAVFGPPRDSARIFISGHSLTDDPLAADLRAIADSLGTPARYNQQIMIGSSIRARTRGMDAAADWSGYRQGRNREGEKLDVLSELKQPRTIEAERYDTLIVTERHDLAGSLMWEDTVRYLRHFHERLIESNPAGQTYFYESWADLSNKDDPSEWIAYERAASPLWRCMATRVNQSLALEGRSDRITSLPAGAALAALVAQATQPPGLPGVSAGSVRETVDRIVADDVHLTRLGAYYMALVTYSAVFRRSPEGAWAPDGMDAAQARSLQSVAWRHVSHHYANETPQDLAQCRQVLKVSFCDVFWDYWRRNDKGLMAYVKTRRNKGACRSMLSRDDAGNPLHFDPQTDRDYWLPAP